MKVTPGRPPLRPDPVPESEFVANLSSGRDPGCHPGYTSVHRSGRGVDGVPFLVGAPSTILGPTSRILLLRVLIFSRPSILVTHWLSSVLPVPSGGEGTPRLSFPVFSTPRDPESRVG